MTSLGQPTRNVARDWHPHVQLVVKPLDAAPKVRAPERVLAAVVANRLKRDCNFNGVTVGGQRPFRLKHDVETEIFIPTVSPDAVGLDAERVEIKLVRLAFVVKSVE